MAAHETLAQRVARTLEDPDGLDAKWSSWDCSYHFPDGSAGSWNGWAPGSQERAFLVFPTTG